MDEEHESTGTTPTDDSPPEPTSPPEPEPAATPEAEPEPIHHAPARELGPGFLAGLVLLLFAIGYSIAFVVGNDRKIHVDFVFNEADVSLIWTILLLLLVGLVAGLLLSHLYRHHRSKKPRKD